MLISHSPKVVFISQTSTYLHIVCIVNLLHIYPPKKHGKLFAIFKF